MADQSRMKVIITMLTIAAIGWRTPEMCSAEPLLPAVAALAASNTAFACDLYAQLKTQDGNLFFSPYSVSTALAMTYAGARGETAAQMAKTLHFALGQQELHPVFAALAGQIDAVEASGHVKLSIANAVWPDRAVPLLDVYRTLLKKDYGSTVTAVDYVHEGSQARAQINQWVADKTQNKIQNLIGAPLDPQTRLVLVNAVYFKGTWAGQFKTNETQTAPFYRPSAKPLQVRMMTQTHTYKYGEWENLQVLELPYAGDEVSMLVLLPSAADGVTNLESRLSADQVRQWRERLFERKVQVFLPKFNITWGARSLKGDLQALDMHDAFDQMKADLSGMDGRVHGLFVADVLQKAFVDVNEEGTEAAATTGVTMRSLAMMVPQPPPVFRADHPFVFLIQENRTGSILFMGRIVNPTANGSD
jgi:serpin B